MSRAVYRFGSFELRPADYALTRGNDYVRLNPKTFDVLAFLVERNGRLVEKHDLLGSLWPDTFVEDANLSVQIAAIRRVLGRRPDGGEYIETVPKRGYRFAARVDRSVDPEPGGGTATTTTVHDSAAARDARPRARLVVLPLTILRPDPETDFLAFSLPDAIAASLAELPSIQVRSPLASARHAVGDDLAALAATTGGTMALAGTLVRSNDGIRISLQLLDLPDATLWWSESLTTSLDALFDVEHDVTRRVRRVLAARGIIDADAQQPTPAPRSAGAYAFYLRANQLAYEASQWTHARDLYDECLRADPEYAPAWVGLARCQRVIGKYTASMEEANTALKEAERGFERALSLDPDLSAAHNLYAQLEVDLGRAEDAMRRLIARVSRHPVDPQLYAGLVHALRFCGLLDESIAAHRRARELDATVPTSVHHTWWMLGEYERALGETYGDIGYMPGLALASLGRDREAIAALRWRERDTRDDCGRPYLASLRALLEDRRDESLAAIGEAIGRRLDAEALYYLARSYARLDEKNQALSTLERAVTGGFLCHQTFERDPWLAPLAGNPRFQAIVEQAQDRSNDARAAFVAAGGPQLLG